MSPRECEHEISPAEVHITPECNGHDEHAVPNQAVCFYNKTHCAYVCLHFKKNPFENPQKHNRFRGCLELVVSPNAGDSGGTSTKYEYDVICGCEPSDDGLCVKQSEKCKPRPSEFSKPGMLIP